MDHDFFSRFYPRIVDVFHRGNEFWAPSKFEITRDPTLVYNIIFVHRGSGILELHGATYELMAGHLFHFSPGCRMRLASSKETPLTYYSINFDYRMVKWEGAAIQTGDSIGGLPLPTISFLPETSLLQNSFEALFGLWARKDSGYEWQARLGFQQLLIEIGRVTNRQQREESQVAQLIARSEQYIKENYSKSMDRDELAGKVSLSLSYYSIMFKKWTGYSPLQYIHNVRIEHAKQLLRNGNSLISEIAREVGFEDPLYFARVFTKKTGLSPRDYRKV